MKTGWVWASGVLMGVGLIVACGDEEPGGLDPTPINTPDGGNGTSSSSSSGSGTSSSSSSGVITPPDSGADASLPPACNDGKIDLGETCDPLASCPTACPPDKCQLRSLENGGTCGASCANVALQTACINGDGCCPPTCNAINDSDCAATCGNNVKEGDEVCDGDCPTTCLPLGCQPRKPDGALCHVTCVADPGGAPVACSAAGSDSCCPVGGCGMINDPDCAAGGCGNGTKDASEACDTGIPKGQPGACPTSCPPILGPDGGVNACKVRQLVVDGCQTACVDKPDISVCANGDGCCAAGCNANNDSDCQPSCGNNVKEPGEECDGDCPTMCAAQGCQLYKVDQPGTCKAKCVPDTVQTECRSNDQCCPAACTPATDTDCVAVVTCPNGRIDPGETCDNGPGSPAPCPMECTPSVPTYSCFAHRGKAATCDLACNTPILACSGREADGCCPYAGTNGTECRGGTTGRTDVDCQSAQGWRVVSTPAAVTLAAGECASVTIDNVSALGSYELTTCVPPGDPAPAGNAVIGNPKQDITTGVIGPIRSATYAVGNDDCTDRNALPLLAGWSCTNKSGAPSMACASPSPGGFIVNYSSPLDVEVCTASAKGGTFPISVFYNASKIPTIAIKLHPAP